MVTTSRDHPGGKPGGQHSRYQRLIHAEQIRQLYKLAPIGFVATIINSIIVFYIMKDVIGRITMFGWLASIIAITIARAALVIAFRSVAPGPDEIGKWGTRFTVGIAAAGTAWGSIACISFSELSITHQVFLAFVLGGMAAGASSTDSMVKLGFPAYGIPVLGPLALRFFLEGDAVHVAMGTMLTLFGVLLWKIALHNNSLMSSALLLGFQKANMIDSLKLAKERVERLNAQLSAEIEAKHRAEAELRAHQEQLERAVQERTADLTAANHELEQFAYVASHDLQEPLRMVTSYLQLLRQKYHGQLDEKADLYINFAVDGGLRMHKLIDGLLSYSRLSRGSEFSSVDLNAAYAVAVANLTAAIEESGAQVTRSDLPVVWGDELQLQQLLQNLIGNGLKYRERHTVPMVHVSAEKNGREWVFTVRDNGIGIQTEHYDRIFNIFQRLHTREEYPGTGIGLALCRKIVERHGGQIWVRSEPGQGSVFSFTIPAEVNGAETGNGWNPGR